MVEGGLKKTKQAKRGTKVGMDEDPIKEGVFDFRSIVGMCFWVFGSLPFQDCEKRIGLDQTRFDSWSDLDPNLVDLSLTLVEKLTYLAIPNFPFFF